MTAEVLRAVQTSGLALEHASHQLKDDEEVVLRAVQGAGLALEFASTRWDGTDVWDGYDPPSLRKTFYFWVVC